MKAMILAAGRGERMRPLTDHTPKPLLLAADKALIVHTIDQLCQAGFTEIVINLAHLGEQIKHFLGNGHRFKVAIEYSDEGDSALETAGGIIKALPLLGSSPFLVVNGDIATDFPFASLRTLEINLAHLILVNNPVHHPDGDFGLDQTNNVVNDAPVKLTFSGIGVYSPALFEGCLPGKQKLAPLLRSAIEQQRITGQKFEGFWLDIGTPERLLELDHHYRRGTHS
ncbi:N-acetylmuramate alpha-1-phosphate uridylyltransferase MurU [Methylicorpusculum sp.]|uniref:N-acetylmuramate alpha-1-phosphate uridylyltransferase MurU n=1 Tax=Methylicorpusculum sp. TaxID=2713644 RepID=UPI00273053D2|nr:nucleotidyltransferase family protein [Methylicorpusculum sp.]MDP2179026.1 nucleotidyltransferase family protein [Methylicorpusculum sp.]MDP3528384.1 nucleotidyltransferase family protein [Methylicorpusculum sp.]MDZ4149855.1 nucleotidyltransferase family protein [Methylicorpusculum sp.]